MTTPKSLEQIAREAAEKEIAEREAYVAGCYQDEIKPRGHYVLEALILATEQLRQENEALRRDKEIVDFLLRQGVAWRGCYEGTWAEGEWLYDFQDGRNTIYAAITANNKEKE